MSEEIEGLKKTIAQKDEMINVMKTRTKEFVTKLKDEQAEQMAAFTAQMQQKEAALVQELEAGRKALKNLSDVKPVLLDLKSKLATVTAEKDAVDAEKFSLQQDLDTAKKDMEQLQIDTAKKMKEREEQAAATAAILEQKLREFESEKAALFASSTAQRSQLEAEVSALRTRTQELESVAAGLAEDLNRAKSSTASQFNEHSAEVTKLKSEIAAALKANSELESNKLSLSKELESVRAGIQGESTNAIAVQEELQALKADYAALLKVKGQAEDSIASLSEKLQLMQVAHAAEVGDLTQKLSAVTTQVDLSQLEMVALQAEYSALLAENAQAKDTAASISKKLELLEAAKAAEVGDLTQKLLAETAKVDSSLKEFHTLNAEYSVILEEKAQAENSATSLSKKLELLQATTTAEVSDLTQKLSSATIQVESSLQEIESLKSQVSSLAKVGTVTDDEATPSQGDSPQLGRSKSVKNIFPPVTNLWNETTAVTQPDQGDLQIRYSSLLEEFNTLRKGNEDLKAAHQLLNNELEARTSSLLTSTKQASVDLTHMQLQLEQVKSEKALNYAESKALLESALTAKIAQLQEQLDKATIDRSADVTRREAAGG
eukprot:gene31778-41244_t